MPASFSAVVAKLTGVNIIVVLAGLVSGPILARALGVDGRGVYASVVVPMTIAPGLLGLGMTAFFTREASRGTPTRLLVGSVGPLYIAGGIVAGIFAHPLARLLAQDNHTAQRLLVIAFWAMPVFIIGLGVIAVANGHQEWNRVAAARLVPPVVAMIGLPVLAVTHHVTLASAVVLAMVAGFLAPAPVLLRRVRARSPQFSRAMAVAALRYGSAAWLWQVASTTNARLDQLVMTPLASSRQLGLYAVAITYASLPALFVGAIGQAIMPKVGAMGLHSAPRIVRTTLLLTSVTSIGLAAAAPFLIPVVYGGEFSGSVIPVLVLLPSGVLGTLLNVLTPAMLAAGRPRVTAVAEITSAVVTVGTLFSLVPIFGATGAALASLLATLPSGLILLRSAAKEAEVSPLRFVVPTTDDVRALVAQLMERGRPASQP